MSERLIKEQPAGYEHLQEGIRPIIACVGDKASFKEYPGRAEAFSRTALDAFMHHERHRREDDYIPLEVDPNVLEVDWFAWEEKLDSLKIKHGGEESYVISPVDSRDKLTKESKECVGLFVVGKENGTGENISFLSHQNTTFILHFNEAGKEKFITDLRESLKEIKDRSVPGTIDALIFGGKDIDERTSHGRTYHTEYVELTDLIGKIIEEVLGFRPKMLKPKKAEIEDDVLADTKERRIYLRRYPQYTPQVEHYPSHT